MLTADEIKIVGLLFFEVSTPLGFRYMPQRLTGNISSLSNSHIYGRYTLLDFSKIRHNIGYFVVLPSTQPRIPRLTVRLALALRSLSYRKEC